MIILRHMIANPPARNSWFAAQSPFNEDSLPDPISHISPHAIATACRNARRTARAMAERRRELVLGVGDTPQVKDVGERDQHQGRAVLPAVLPADVSSDVNRVERPAHTTSRRA